MQTLFLTPKQIQWYGNKDFQRNFLHHARCTICVYIVLGGYIWYESTNVHGYDFISSVQHDIVGYNNNRKIRKAFFSYLFIIICSNTPESLVRGIQNKYIKFLIKNLSFSYSISIYNYNVMGYAVREINTAGTAGINACGNSAYTLRGTVGRALSMKQETAKSLD